jgi:methionine-rich copper-binding protein CopC
MQFIAYSNLATVPPAIAQFDWKFSDGNSGLQGDGGPLSVTGNSSIRITARNVAPTLVTAVPDIDAFVGQPLRVVLATNTFTDKNEGDKLSYTLAMGDGSPSPPWLTFDPIAKAFYGTPELIDLGIFDIRISAKDIAGASSADTFRLTVAPPDTVSPTVTAFSPADGALGVAVGSNIVFTFSEAVAKGAGAITLKTADGATVATYDASASANLSISGNTLTINPSADLSYSTGYRVEFAAGTIKDMAGNNYAGSTNYNFNTLADPVNQTFTGTAASESFTGGTGNDTIDGAGGTDTAAYSGKITDYFIKYNRALGIATITDHRANADGTDSLKSIEKLQFADKTFDLLNPARTESAAFGKSQSFLFDPAYYLLKHPDLVPTVTLVTAFESYKTTAAQGAAPNAWFDPVYYANRWADLKPLNLDAVTLFAHYNLYGVWEGRSAGPTFDKYDGTRYLKDNPDVAAYVDAYVADFLGSRSNGAIAHYVIYGAAEGRVAYDTAGVAIEQAILIGVPG